jgi:hypothetical protein
MAYLSGTGLSQTIDFLHLEENIFFRMVEVRTRQFYPYMTVILERARSRAYHSNTDDDFVQPSDRSGCTCWLFSSSATRRITKNVGSFLAYLNQISGRARFRGCLVEITESETHEGRQRAWSSMGQWQVYRNVDIPLNTDAYH